MRGFNVGLSKWHRTQFPEGPLSLGTGRSGTSLAQQIKEMHEDEVPLDEMVIELGLEPQFTADEMKTMRNLAPSDVAAIRAAALGWLQANPDISDPNAIMKLDAFIKCDFDAAGGGVPDVTITQDTSGQWEIRFSHSEHDLQPSAELERRKEELQDLERDLDSDSRLEKVFECLGIDRIELPLDRAVNALTDDEREELRRRLRKTVRRWLRDPDLAPG